MIMGLQINVQGIMCVIINVHSIMCVKYVMNMCVILICFKRRGDLSKDAT